MRKMAVSSVHQQAPEMTANLADLKCHRVDTASKCYRIVNRDKTAVAAAARLGKWVSSFLTAHQHSFGYLVPVMVGSIMKKYSDWQCTFFSWRNL